MGFPRFPHVCGQLKKMGSHHHLLSSRRLLMRCRQFFVHQGARWNLIIRVLESRSFFSMTFHLLCLKTHSSPVNIWCCICIGLYRFTMCKVTLVVSVVWCFWWWWWRIYQLTSGVVRIDIHLKQVDNKFKACSACCTQKHCQAFRKGLCCTPKRQGADRLHEQKQHARTAVPAIAFALRPESLRHCRIPSMNLKGAGGCIAMFASVAVIAHLQ